MSTDGVSTDSSCGGKSLPTAPLIGGAKCVNGAGGLPWSR
jgi:hypothetical protein